MKQLLAVGIGLITSFVVLSSCNQKDASVSSVISDSDRLGLTIPLYGEEFTPSRFVWKYIPVINYNLSNIDSNDFRVTYQDTLNNLPIFWRFGIKDRYLSYYGFSFEECALSKGCFDKLYNIADSLISAFTSRYGSPIRKTTNETNFYSDGQFPEYPGVIVAAFWTIGDQRIRVHFSASGEHNMYSYFLDVSKSKSPKVEP